MLFHTLLPGAVASEDLPVVRDGEATAVIIQNSEGGRVVGLAVEELRDHVEAITGVTLEVVRAGDWNPAGGETTAMIIGQGDALEKAGIEIGELPVEGYRILSDPEKRILVLAGRDDGNPLGTAAPHTRHQEFGSLYAVYDLLEDWGVRWLFPGELGTILPETDTLAVTETDRSGSPDFQMRNLWLDSVTLPDGTTLDARDALRGNYDEDADRKAVALEGRMWSLRNRAGNSTDKYNTRHHTPRWWDLWGEEDPERLGLYRGQRGWLPNPLHGRLPREVGRSKLCISHPDVPSAVAELALEDFRNNPNRISYSIGEQDGAGGFCSCAGCLALDSGELMTYGMRGPGIYARYGKPSLTDRYLWFANQVGELVGEEFPDRYVGIYIYSKYRDLPVRETTMQPNVRAVYVNNNEVHPDRLKEVLGGWSEIAPHPIGIYIPPMFGAWPLRDFQRDSLPVSTLENVYEGYLFCREQGVIGTRGNPNFTPNHVGSKGLLAYATARWHWDADVTPEEVLRDFCQHAFGPAAPAMVRYFNTMEERQNAHPIPPLNEFQQGIDNPWLDHHLAVFTPEFLDQLREILEEAREAVSDGSEADQARVELFAENLEFTAAQLQVIRAWDQFMETGEGFSEMVESTRNCLDLYNSLSLYNRAPRDLFQRSEAARMLAFSGSHDGLAVLDPSQWELRADFHNEGMDEKWYGEPGAGEQWRKVDMRRGYDVQGVQATDGPVWYRTTFTVPEGVDAEALGLAFRVSNTSADLFLNGEPLGQQILGEGDIQETTYDGQGNLVPADVLDPILPRVYPLGDLVQPGQENQLVIRVWGYTDRGVGFLPTLLVTGR